MILLGPKFSQKERRAINLNRQFSIQQVEYCRNFIFRRHFPIHKLFERSCDIGFFRLTADKMALVFGFPNRPSRPRTRFTHLSVATTVFFQHRPEHSLPAFRDTHGFDLLS
jgi:hypothetical protein